MPVIRISDGTMQRLKTWAEPLEDTAESALSKALDAAEEARKRTRPDLPKPDLQKTAAPATRHPRRQPISQKLPQKEFRKPLLEVLYELGGSVRVIDLRPAMRNRMMSAFLPGDLEHVSTGEERWWNATCWERSNLIKEGFLRDDSPRGTWELSEQGIGHVEGYMERSKSSDSFIAHLLAMPEVGDDVDFDRERSASRRLEL